MNVIYNRLQFQIASVIFFLTDKPNGMTSDTVFHPYILPGWQYITLRYLLHYQVSSG